MAKLYSVNVGPAVAGHGAGTRRRGGVVFGASPVIVGTAEGDGVTKVDDKALAAILADPELEATETSAAEAAKAAAPAEEPAARAPRKAAIKKK